jgi:hypothetical protein
MFSFQFSVSSILFLRRSIRPLPPPPNPATTNSTASFCRCTVALSRHMNVNQTPSLPTAACHGITSPLRSLHCSSLVTEGKVFLLLVSRIIPCHLFEMRINSETVVPSMNWSVRWPGKHGIIPRKDLDINTAR